MFRYFDQCAVILVKFFLSCEPDRHFYRVICMCRQQCRMTISRLLLAVLATATATIALAQETDFTTDKLSFTKVSDGVYVRFGQHLPISENAVAHIANQGFIIGSRSVAIIDPGGSKKAAQATLDALHEFTDLPVSHVIVTHVHPDHSLGLLAYSRGVKNSANSGETESDRTEFDNTESGTDVEPILLGHPGLPGALAQNLDFFGERFADPQQLEHLQQQIDSNRITGIKPEHTIDLGDRVLVLTAFGDAHTGTDITVYDQASKILWAGDLLFVERLPVLDGSLRGWLDAMKSLDAMDISTVIPGHGRSGPWRGLANPQRQYLQSLLDNARAAVGNGTSLNKFVNSAPELYKLDQWELTDPQHPTNLSRAYTEVEWE